MNYDNSKLSAKTIWGKVVLYLREKKEIALHVACGDIRDVELRDNDFIINVSDGMMINLLEDGINKIKNAIRWQGFDFNLKLKIKTNQKSAEEEDIEKLKNMFGDYLIVKGGK